MTDEKPFSERLGEALKRNDLEIKGGKIGTPAAEDESGMGYGLRIGVEFVAGTLAGAGLGYGIDRFFDTLPLFLLIGLVLGFGAGMLNVYRAVNDIPEGIGIHRQKSRVKDGENNLTEATKPPKSSPTD